MRQDKQQYYKDLTEQNLSDYFGNALSSALTELNSAIRYSLLNGGKRIRAILVYAIGEILNCDKTLLQAPACAVELIHAYSLVHDDLPAMDDSPLRRGKPSAHIQYSEATAILAGDALLTLAFECLSSCVALSDSQKIKMITELSRASGASGMIEGQMQDIAAENNSLSLEQLTQLHYLKTGKLIEASMILGAIATNAHDETILTLRKIARHLGIAFQIKDDLLDATGDESQLGKPKSDMHNAKTTYVSLLGVDEASIKLLTEIESASKLLTQLIKTPHWVHELIDFVGKRQV